MNEDNVEPSFVPVVRRARFERLTIYEVSDSELETLERGSPVSLYLNLAIALLSVAISLTATLFSSTMNAPALFTIFVVCTVVGIQAESHSCYSIAKAV